MRARGGVVTVPAAASWAGAGLAAREEEALRRLERLASWLDDRFRVPGLGFRFGLDPILGLAPGVGDGLSAIVALYTVLEARRLGAPAGLLARMLLNIGLDAALGSVPVLGDVFDVAFKSNRRNLTLLRRHLARGRPRA